MAPQANPAVILDQLYLRFDILRTVFVTVGRQKMKWGTAHVWNPTDALNAQKRDPLQPRRTRRWRRGGGRRRRPARDDLRRAPEYRSAGSRGS